MKRIFLTLAALANVSMLASLLLGLQVGDPMTLGGLDPEGNAAMSKPYSPAFRRHALEVEWWGGQFASGQTDPGHPLVRDLGEVATGILGTRPEVYAAPYGSDLRLLVGAGIPTVHFGPGESAAAHAPAEWVDLRETLACARILAAYAVRFCGTSA